MSRYPIALVVAVSLVAATCGAARAQNLVSNPGFETGNFSSWTTAPAAFGSDFGVDGGPHTGADAAFFGAVAPPFEDTISQTLTTVAGDQYDFDFWLRNDGGPANDFNASWNGTQIFDVHDARPFAYTHEVFTETATSTSTTISFASYQVPSFFRLDDVTVLDLGPSSVPEPGALALLIAPAVPFAGFLARRKLRRM